jgi:hypothetical protein
MRMAGSSSVPPRAGTSASEGAVRFPLEARRGEHAGQVEHHLAGRGVGDAREEERLHLVDVARIEVLRQLEDRAPVGRHVAFADGEAHGR